MIVPVRIGFSNRFVCSRIGSARSHSRLFCGMEVARRQLDEPRGQGKLQRSVSGDEIVSRVA
jgi:hypothetical protein